MNGSLGYGFRDELHKFVDEAKRKGGSKKARHFGKAARLQERSRSKDQRQRALPRSSCRPIKPPAAAPRMVPVVCSPRVSTARPASAPAASPTMRPVVPFERRQ